MLKERAITVILGLDDGKGAAKAANVVSYLLSSDCVVREGKALQAR